MRLPSLAPLVLVAAAAPAAGQEVPLVLWTDANFPGGVVFGDCYGVSVGDFDSDGWVDVYVNYSGRLWRNLEGAVSIRNQTPYAQRIVAVSTNPAVSSMWSTRAPKSWRSSTARRPAAAIARASSGWSR